MEFRRLDPVVDQNLLREFLVASDPDDYLLEEFPDWAWEGRLWAGEEGGAMLSFGRLHDLGEGEGWVSAMRVLASRRGEGLGHQLLDRILADARSAGLPAVRAVIEDGNSASRRLFARHGFQSVAVFALRRGLPSPGPAPKLVRARADVRLDGPVGWVPESTGHVDLLPGGEGGQFGRWRPSLVERWAREGKLYVGPGVAVAVQPDWWKNPHTLWVNPLRGDPAELVAALGGLTRELHHEEWQAFLPSGDDLRAEYDRLGLLPHPYWGDRVHLYERLDAPDSALMGGVPRTRDIPSP